jgi:DNA-binding beta-propeller fold protein YncE
MRPQARRKEDAMTARRSSGEGGWWSRGLTVLAALGLSACATTAPVALAPGPQFMIVGIDEKVTWDETGKVALLPPGKDVVSVVDISNRETPRIVVSLPLMNSIFGPPTNLAITPDERVAIVANSMAWTPDGSGWKAVPDNKLYVIDLTANPPRQVATVEGGKQPSGLAISARGDLMLVANRADNSISVFSLQGTTLKLVDTVAMGEQVASVAITRDGRSALVTKFPGHKIALLKIDGHKVTYDKYDMPVGLWPYNVDVTPDGKLGLTADNGNAGGSDGHVDTVSVIDLEATPPRVIDRVVVGDAPEGFAISPTGEIAVAILLNGSAGVAKNAWFANKGGKVAVLRIDGKKVTKVKEIGVGGLPEGVVFSADGKYIYVGNYTTRDVSILRVDGTDVTDTGKRFALPGQPASMRGRAR